MEVTYDQKEIKKGSRWFWNFTGSSFVKEQINIWFGFLPHVSTDQTAKLCARFQQSSGWRRQTISIHTDESGTNKRMFVLFQVYIYCNSLHIHYNNHIFFQFSAIHIKHFTFHNYGDLEFLPIELFYMTTMMMVGKQVTSVWLLLKACYDKLMSNDYEPSTTQNMNIC